jgi:hypothetical protein
VQAPFDHLFAPTYDPILNWGKQTHAPYFNYGTDPELDRISQATIGMMPQKIQDQVNDLRAFGKNKWEVYPLDGQSFQNVMQQSVAN